MNHLNTRFSLSALSLLTAMLIAACGGGGTTSSPTTLAGKVIDGYITGATVCLDVNSNNTCDAGEPTARRGVPGPVRARALRDLLVRIEPQCPVGRGSSTGGGGNTAMKDSWRAAYFWFRAAAMAPAESSLPRRSSKGFKPMKTMPAFSSLAANSVFSERKP